jgi:hypothetical protein
MCLDVIEPLRYKRMERRVLIEDSDEDDDYIPYHPPASRALSKPPAPPPPSRAVAAPVTAIPQLALQNGVRFPGPTLPFDAMLSAARSSGIFDVGHTCNVTKRSGTSTMGRFECSRCLNRQILHQCHSLFECLDATQG